MLFMKTTTTNPLAQTHFYRKLLQIKPWLSNQVTWLRKSTKSGLFALK